MKNAKIKKAVMAYMLSTLMVACGGGSAGGSSTAETSGNDNGGSGNSNNGGNTTENGGGMGASIDDRIVYGTKISTSTKGKVHALNILDGRTAKSTEIARDVIYAGTVYSAANPHVVENVTARRLDENLAPWVWFVTTDSTLKLLDVAKGSVKTISTTRSLSTLCDMDVEEEFAVARFSDDSCRSTWKIELVDGSPGRVSVWTDEDYVEKLHVWTAGRVHVGKFSFPHEGGPFQYMTDSGSIVNGFLPAFDYINLLAAHDAGAAVQFWAETENERGELAFRRYSLNKTTGALTELEKVVYTDTSSYASAYGPRVVFKHVNSAATGLTRTFMYDDLSDSSPRISKVTTKSLSSPSGTMTGRMVIVVDDQVLVLDLTQPSTIATPTIASLTEASFDVPGYSSSSPAGRVFHVLHDAGNTLTRIDLASLSAVRLPNTRPLITAGSYYSLEYANGGVTNFGYEATDWFYITQFNLSNYVNNGYQGGTVAWFNPATSSLAGFDTVDSRLFTRGGGNTTGHLVIERATLSDGDPNTTDDGFFWIDAESKTWHESRAAGDVTILSPGSMLDPR